MAGAEKHILQKFEQAQDALVLQASDLSLETIASMVDSHAIDVGPQFQRRDRWDINRQSALIESFLLNIPVPPVYLAEEEFGSYSVIDGKQRITAVRDFMRNQYQLSGLERFSEIEGYRFKELPVGLRNALAVRPYIRAISILRQSDPETKYEVFHRLNSAGQPLNAQEIRNVIYRGPLNDLIMDLSSNRFLESQLKIRDSRSPAYRGMADVEMVLRFLTLRESWDTFSGDLRSSMDNFMEMYAKGNSLTLQECSRAFQRSISACESLWGNKAFKRPDRDGWRDQMLAGMFDAQMIAVDQLSDEQIKRLARQRNEVLRTTRELFERPEFEAAVRVATNTPSRIYLRIAEMRNALLAVAS
ncbi:DUF262 domain-containing protein [Streptomyces sp. JH010]|uniref:DUF262 domain-containing protein n=1 Tax=unclassified Streptomyces TaxID=2593676 RepID=UPI002275979F|nr:MULTISPECIES: DUF262 domain-containing protein [unclassified Streptomyces]MCY1652877.1 DUF262 domain-containing protein [Streptomyces sp. SL203]MCY1679904.1 DUF262 domain-containing protein [Streptomyces sp. SL294]MDF6063881.1 DUF262 domain-containing protein [Streptomyces sp. JH010]